MNAQPPDGPSSQGAGDWIDGRLARFAQWAQQKSGPDDASRLPFTTSETGSELESWFALSRAVATFGLEVAQVPGAASGVRILEALLGTGGAQVAMLASIDRKVTLILEGPFRAAQIHLKEAGRITSSDPDYNRHLQQARDKFIDAHGLAASIQDRAVVEMHLGVVYLLLGRRSDASHWLSASYDSARAVVDHFAETAGNVKVLRSKWSTAAASYAYVVGVAVFARKMKKVWNAQRALAAMRSFIPFVNCVADSYNGVSSSGSVAVLHLEQTGANKFVLRETTR
ncbi:hypothetical protein GCM10023194_30690 [Planotetraspora phitsanulokensis]|uniref:Uncharacterized protein n=1 Tax=Planotetraspora phitsanulokensis TaxID=575192 RepID=A0A8J3XGQ8_9ACTN|nr:hypothetical protein [Planotetraspora phitsanulokensis]GII35793.1 hypothetical protein Pph01_07960 [Planotetraspora phitsanulokensis]